MGAAALELIGRLLINVVAPLMRGDESVLERKVGDVVPAKLRTTIARESAEARARAKFGGR